jgi:uncharacterized protein YndB with AHSA1/START domain
MAKSTFVYVTYIRTTPQKLWSALTDVEFMKQYWFGVHCESEWTAGSSWKLVYPDGRNTDAGEIVEAEPQRRLVIRWQHQDEPELKAEGESHCTMELVACGQFSVCMAQNIWRVKLRQTPLAWCAINFRHIQI